HSISLLSHAPPTSHIYSLSLHDALPISRGFPTAGNVHMAVQERRMRIKVRNGTPISGESSLCGTCRCATIIRGRSLDEELERSRSEEHTSELQSLRHLVCRLLLEKKKKK